MQPSPTPPRTKATPRNAAALACTLLWPNGEREPVAFDGSRDGDARVIRADGERLTVPTRRLVWSAKPKAAANTGAPAMRDAARRPTITLACLSILAAAGLVLLLTALGGCQLVPSERTQQTSDLLHESTAAKVASDVVRETASRPSSLTISVSGEHNTVAASQPAGAETTSASTTGDEAAASRKTSEASGGVTIPWGVKVGLAGVGLALFTGAMLFAWWASRKMKSSSATAQTISGLFDSTIQQLVGVFAHAATSATGPEAVAQAAANLATAQRIATEAQTKAPSIS